MKRFQKWLSVLLIMILATSVPISLTQASAASQKLVAITFDDGPSGYTPKLLDGLKARGAKATFFCVGTNASAHADTLKRMVNEGHQIANHTYSHPQLTKLGASEIQNELSKCRKYLVSAAGEQTFCLRPPYGSYNNTVKQTANCPLILWSVDTLDWKSRNADSVYNVITRETKDGSIILLHDLYSTSVTAALRAIDTLQQQGYEFVTVKELFRRRGITLENGKVYSSAYNQGITLPAEDGEAPSVAVQDVWGGKQVTLICKTKGAQIYYTVDGSVPTEKSKKYSGAFIVDKSVSLRAIAVYQNTNSAVLTKSITVSKTAVPQITHQGKTLTLTCATKGAVMYYTTDKTNPTASSKTYTKPFVAQTTTKVLARAKGYADSTACFTFTQYGDLFQDVPEDTWYYKPVGQAVHQKLMKGTAPYVFQPNDSLTRAMFVTILARLADADLSVYKSTAFQDVKAGTWYTAAVAWANQMGYTKGVSETEFSPDESITREQMCTMLYRFLKKQNYAFSKQTTTSFADQAQISPWAKQAVNVLHQDGLINGVGDNRVAPKEISNRASAAKLFISVQNRIQ